MSGAGRAHTASAPFQSDGRRLELAVAGGRFDAESLFGLLGPTARSRCSLRRRRRCGNSTGLLQTLLSASGSGVVGAAARSVLPGGCLLG